MRYKMKQRLFSFSDDFDIVDDNGDEIATVDGKVFAIGNKLVFNDPDGRELAKIQQKLIALKPTYEITRAGKHVATVSKDFFTFLRCSFTVDVPGPDDLEAQGSFTEHEYTFKRGGKRVATVSKAWFSIRDSYGVDVADGEDPILILASAVVIDLCCHDEDARKH
jgi:uncharacterized protein YxjI